MECVALIVLLAYMLEGALIVNGFIVLVRGRVKTTFWGQLTGGEARQYGAVSILVGIATFALTVLALSFWPG